jgi:pimeloyl-ACP methyl ester carboxylesterase
MAQVAVDKIVFNYVEYGDGKLTPALFLHGWGRSGTEWYKIAKGLSGLCGRKIFVVDLPGFGGSSLPKVKDIFEYSELLYRFCKYMGISKVMLIGHSLGGRIGLVLASKYPLFVEKLILIDPAGVKQTSIKRTTMNLVSKMFAFVPRSIRLKFVSGLMDEDFRNSPTTGDLYRAVVKHDLRSALPQIKCKTWVIWGEKDKVLPLKLTDVYKKLLTYPIVRIIWGAGHDPHLSHGVVLTRILEEALWT